MGERTKGASSDQAIVATAERVKKVVRFAE
jgi:hypothetical protein